MAVHTIWNTRKKVAKWTVVRKFAEKIKTKCSSSQLGPLIAHVTLTQGAQHCNMLMLYNCFNKKLSSTENKLVLEIA
uniref:Uncharacterized protein n=1 Tax=Rhizophora mucronata TaxID=61149 RepID=A0A2P2Q8X3_RHIMU